MWAWSDVLVFLKMCIACLGSQFVPQVKILGNLFKFESPMIIILFLGVGVQFFILSPWCSCVVELQLIILPMWARGAWITIAESNFWIALGISVFEVYGVLWKNVSVRGGVMYMSFVQEGLCGALFWFDLP
ncbi:hypothetical protein GOODEAATRI_027879 [Goodea atripinnis]|uniref:ATP synthase F0 subunit 6 n=1 Tax=Goodea atripinnis TaxID=208336 RepID=A0ABV0PHS0_9TELE